MPTTRRTFLIHTAATGAAFACSGMLPHRRASAQERSASAGAAPSPRTILFLGGTGFLGPAFIEQARARGHTITLFNRGNRSELFPEIEQIEGNRITDIEPGLQPLRALVESGRRWDAVIDTASVHTWVENSAALLAPAAKQYLFVSSLSVYADGDRDEQTETDPLATMTDEIAATIDRLPYDMTHYGAVKARSEQAAQRYFKERATIVRPGLIVGPRDFTHRFTYWPWRVRQGGAVLAPGAPDHPVMFIDVRDVAAFMLRLVEQQTGGVFNANGPASGAIGMGELLSTCRSVTGSDATFTWVPAEKLTEHGVQPWSDMPVWIPPVGEYRAFHRTNLEKAKAAGLRTRPLETTIRETLAWLDEWLPEAKEKRGFEYKPGETAPGITRERERKILEEMEG